MKIEFVCQKGAVGPLHVGMRRAEVRYILGGIYEEFKKSPFSENTTDDFPHLKLHVFYSKNDIIKGVELFPAAGIFFKGYNLFALKLNDILIILDKLSVGYEIGDVGIRIPEAGIRVYAPEILDSNVASIEAIYCEL
ncbi:hypothetical protein [Xanthomonas floridensis]|uniref:Uncharacterized protein n=1 Tax=Xanthomonas floridensis TaxID=1843580 RepID=A0ABU5Q3H0_9XANT|nr:hypothetical protein [Xanthomonas floridensis]MEA5126177.1 hypothetical protein [Xanthomonas floridensis]MEA5134085.1 hypothetical protein [Xanthomonas floridensis]